ncbi:MAG: hypothetical protein ACI8QY_001183, partial [bacterium]
MQNIMLFAHLFLFLFRREFMKAPKITDITQDVIDSFKTQLKDSVTLTFLPKPVNYSFSNKDIIKTLENEGYTVIMSSDMPYKESGGWLWRKTIRIITYHIRPA